ncbi:MAG TPA: family 78 glycoside hydrolase catalytic domain, partial [Candidatus Methylacidiphilales bacterium]|nr:family 78 glycoside hydrolase catalytic domain [Candidatus Methylacidiphilales bacterium]
VGPILEADFLMGETYDARREFGAWSTAAFDDAAWQPVLLPEAPKIAIERSPGTPVRRQEILPGKQQQMPKVAADAPRRLFDFGQNLTGRVRLTVRGPRGAQLELIHAEILENGVPYVANLRKARCRDYYTLKGDGVEVFEPRFTFHGFRFAEIAWKAGLEVTIEKVEAVVLHSEMAATGTFRCSHALLNQLEHNIIWGQKGNFLEVPTDCPQRDERLGWTGDAQVFVRTAAFHFDVRKFFRKWMRDVCDSQGESGAIPPVVPKPLNLGPWLPADGGPAWADAVFICPWTIYRCYGDEDVVRNTYDCMAAYMDYLAKHKVKDFIRAHPEVDDWGGFGDWLALDGGKTCEALTPRDLIGTAMYANNARIMAHAAELLGKTAEVKKYRELHGKIVEAWRNRYITPEGLILGNTQTCYVLGLHFGLIPPALRTKAAAELVRLIKKNGTHLATGFVGTPYLLHVLEAAGHLDVAYALLEQETFPSWLFPVKNGATTIWERWDGWTPDKGFQDVGMNSFNHYAYGAVGDWMVSTVAGLDIGEAGYKKVLFKPRPGGTITWAEAKLRTPQGDAAIHWELKDGKLALELTVPQGSEAELSLPAGWKTDARTLKAGTHKITATAA